MLKVARKSAEGVSEGGAGSFRSDFAGFLWPHGQLDCLFRMFSISNNMYCIFLGSLSNPSYLNKQYELKNSNEAVSVIEAYKTLFDRGSYPAHEGLKDLVGASGLKWLDLVQCRWSRPVNRPPVRSIYGITEGTAKPVKGAKVVRDRRWKEVTAAFKFLSYEQ